MRAVAGLVAVLALGAAGLSACGGHAHAAAVPSMAVTPAVAPLDTPVTVALRGLPHGAQLTVTATAADTSGVTWTGSARFHVPSSGDATLSLPSEGGSYSGVNPMGLFETMKPPSSNTKDTVFIAPYGGSSCPPRAPGCARRC